MARREAKNLKELLQIRQNNLEQIETASLEVTNGARLSADTLGEGKGGSVTVTANI